MEYETQSSNEKNMPDSGQSGEFEALRENYEQEPNNDLAKKFGKAALEEAAVLRGPEDWWTVGQVSIDLEITFTKAQRLLSKISEEQGIESRVYLNNRNQPSTHYSPEVINAVKECLRTEHAPPSGWMTNHQVEMELQRTSNRIRNTANKYKESNPEWFGRFMSQKGVFRTYYSPELVEVLKTSSQVNIAPEGWQALAVVSKDLDVDRETIVRLAKDHPDQIGTFDTKNIKGANSRPGLHLSPKLIGIISEQISQFSTPPKDWKSIGAVAKDLEVDWVTLNNIASKYTEQYPHLTGMYKTKGFQPTRYVAPAIIEMILAERNRYDQKPDGWMNKTQLVQEIGRPKQTIGLAAEKYREGHGDWFRMFKLKGRVSEYFSPDLINVLKAEFENRKSAPEGWRNNKTLSDKLNKSENFVKNKVELYRESNPEWFQFFEGIRGHLIEHYSPELVDLISREAESISEAPNGWVVLSAIVKELSLAYETARYYIDPYRVTNPEWFSIYLDSKGRALEHFSPRLVETVQIDVVNVRPPEGWISVFAAARELSIGRQLLLEKLAVYRESNSEWFKSVDYSRGGDTLVEYLHPDLVASVAESISLREIPDGWVSRSSLAKSLRRSQEQVVEAAALLQDTYPEDSVSVEWANDRIYTYYSPKLAEKIGDQIGRYVSQVELTKDRALIEDQLASTLCELRDSQEGLAFDIKPLLGIFDVETVLDILYQKHPEYKKLPVPYVKSMIGEYLGDFMMVKGEFSLEGLEKGAAFLATPAFKDRLTEVVKVDCLHMLNHLGRMSPDEVNAVAVAEYLEEIRQKSAHIDSPELEKILGEVEAYYTHLFNDIHKPERFIDQLGGNRLFPDINQRINVQELLLKHKLLIADEMGTGKSASAIMAKEIIGAEQALVVVPSNVVSVWESYLSDKTDGDEQLGYFKEGQAPNVLIVNSVEDLKGSDISDYDYVVISQERLNDEYTDVLESLDYDMMIVDEMHKLKNVTSGKRSNNLIRLAEQIDGDDQYLALLSGTPVPNKVGDVALTLRLLYPDRFAGIDNKQLTSQILNGDVLDLRSLLVMRTQMKSLAENVDMPEMKQETEKIQLSEYEKDIYDILLEEDELTASEKLALLRKFTLNPRMLDATPDVVGSKAQHVGGVLRDSFKDKNKIVMFVNGYIEGVIRGEDTVVPDFQLSEDVEICSIHGEVSKDERLEIQRQLQDHDKKMLLLVSGQTADTGVDFSGADEVFHYNEPWSLYDKQQQTARVYRPGLENDLTVRTFVTEATLEEGINLYIEKKYQAIEKVLRGIPISDIEKNMLSQAEKTVDPNAEVSPELAQYYFSSKDKMARIYGFVKEIGEDKFLNFLSKYGQDYADAYADLTGARSYQANMARLSGSVIKNMLDEQAKVPHNVRILDLASGPEILQRHVTDELAGSVYSLDINHRHFTEPGKKVVGSISKLPVADSVVDYVNLSLGLHYTRWAPSRSDFERLETLMEINRVLSIGGRATIGMIHSRKLNDGKELRDTLGKIGFQVIDEYTGEVSSGRSFNTQLLTLEKTADITEGVEVLAGTINPKSLKFIKNEASLVETRKIATRFNLGKTVLPVHMNALDQKVLEEEETAVSQMETLRSTYGGIEKIPQNEIVSQGFSRVFNGKRYVLFRRLDADPSAVVIR